MTKEYIYLVTDEIQLTPICKDCGPNLVPVMRKEELIRCKDCKWWKAEKQECYEWYDSPYAPADGYCFRAERREDA